MARQRDKRGRVNSIDGLPAVTDDIVAGIQREILSRRQSQKILLAKLNDELLALGLEPIAKSPFYRWALDGLRHGFAPRGKNAAAATALGQRCARCGAMLARHPGDAA